MNFLIFFIGCFSISVAQETKPTSTFIPSDVYSGLEEKNLINAKELGKDFAKNFKFTSVRFRDDKNELRLIYANDLASKGLTDENHTYSPGAVFYKAVYGAYRDPIFPSSIAPQTNVKLRQIMFYDPKKFAETGGWGFAVFNGEGKTLPGDPKITNATCFACHQLAENRNYVFSTQMLGASELVSALPRPASAPAKAQALAKELFKFDTKPAHTLDPEITRLLRGSRPNVNMMNGKIMDQGFLGFLPEITSYLVEQSLTNGNPSVAVKEVSGEKIFSYAFVDRDQKRICSSGMKLIRYGTAKAREAPNSKNLIDEFLVCRKTLK